MKNEKELKQERSNILQMIRTQSKVSQQQLEDIDGLAEELQRSLDEVNNVKDEIRETKREMLQVGEFMVDFYNEYREHDALTMAQVKELKEAQHYITSKITKILCPRLTESHKRGSEYLKEWNRVNKGMWSIFKQNVNGVKIPYDRTPKIKFKQAVEYMYSLGVSDYLAYKDERWSDITEFNFVEETGEEKMTMKRILNKDETNETTTLLH